MRQIKDKGIAKLYAAALRARKAKATKGLRPAAKRATPKRRKVTRRKAKRRSPPQARAKIVKVMREFYAGELTSHGRRVPRGRPDIAKAIAMSEGRAVAKPKRRVKRRKVLRTAVAAARKPKRRIVKRTAKRRSSPQARSRPQVDHRVIRHAAPTRGRKQAKRRSTARKAPSAKQLAARKKFVEMVRARAADKKGPNRRKR